MSIFPCADVIETFSVANNRLNQVGARCNRRLPLVLFVLAAVAAIPVCQALLTQFGVMSGANLVPAEYAGLAEKRVAVVCVSESASYGIGIEAEVLARGVAALLKDRIEKTDVVRQDEIADWVDQNDWDEVDYREVGRGVKADRVLAIDLSNFRLYEGQSLYRGRANVKLTVLDMTDGGKEVFRRELPEIKFPVSGVYHSSETSENAFRKTFLKVIAEHVARYFYEYDLAERYSNDPASLE